MTTKETITGTILSVALVAVLFEAHRASNARELAQSLQKQQALLQQQIEALESERDSAVNKLAALREKNRSMAVDLANARAAGGASAVAEGGTTKSDSAADALASSWADVVRRLKARLEATPSAKIPELQLLDSAAWLEIAQHVNLDSDAGYRRALAEVRKRAEGLFTKKFQAALDIYTSANSGQWPASLDQLTRYFFPPVDNAILQRWQIVPKSAFPGRETFPGRELATDWLLTEKSPIDPDFDWRWTVGPSSASVGAYQYSEENEIEALRETVVTPVLKAYMAANDGKQPQDLRDLMAYASGWEQTMQLRRFLEMTATNHVSP
jgi:type II secretory pathway pseudopilin PulG